MEDAAAADAAPPAASPSPEKAKRGSLLLGRKPAAFPPPGAPVGDDAMIPRVHVRLSALSLNERGAALPDGTLGNQSLGQQVLQEASSTSPLYPIAPRQPARLLGSLHPRRCRNRRGPTLNGRRGWTVRHRGPQPLQLIDARA